MEFACSVCQYSSNKKEHIIRHIDRKKSCGKGIKEIIEIPIEIKCEYCNKNFATSSSLKIHKKNSCKSKTNILEEKNKKLEEKIKELELVNRISANTSTTVNNNTFNIYVNNYENTTLDKLTDNIYSNIIGDSDSYQIIPRLIKHIHCNPEIPENHNIRLSNRNKNNKYLEVYRNNQWEIENKHTEIINLISDKEMNMNDWIIEKGNKFPEVLEKYNDYLEQKYDNETANLIKQEVELLLYNNRNLNLS